MKNDEKFIKKPGEWSRSDVSMLVGLEKEERDKYLKMWNPGRYEMGFDRKNTTERLYWFRLYALKNREYLQLNEDKLIFEKEDYFLAIKKDKDYKIDEEKWEDFLKVSLHVFLGPGFEEFSSVKGEASVEVVKKLFRDEIIKTAEAFNISNIKIAETVTEKI